MLAMLPMLLAAGQGQPCRLQPPSITCLGHIIGQLSPRSPASCPSCTALLRSELQGSIGKGDICLARRRGTAGGGGAAQSVGGPGSVGGLGSGRGGGSRDFDWTSATRHGFRFPWGSGHEAGAAGAQEDIRTGHKAWHRGPEGGRGTEGGTCAVGCVLAEGSCAGRQLEAGRSDTGTRYSWGHNWALQTYDGLDSVDEEQRVESSSCPYHVNHVESSSCPGMHDRYGCRPEATSHHSRAYPKPQQSSQYPTLVPP